MRIPGVPYVQGRNSYADPDGRHYGIAIHNTSNNASDEGESSYATRRTDGISSHFYVDVDSVIQSLDTDMRAGHAGSAQGNDNAIAVEITGGNGMTRDWWLSNVAWDKLGATLAYLIAHDPDYVGFQVRRATVAEMKSNPKVKAFYGHDDMRQAWGGTTHTDPGPNFPWDRLLAVVQSALNPAPSRNNMALNEADINNAAAIIIWNIKGWLLENVQTTRRIDAALSTNAVTSDAVAAKLAGDPAFITSLAKAIVVEFKQ